ncbi:hypothetical protein JW835_16090 [bacterium]|nr:hypothetical protein [bacterium]
MIKKRRIFQWYLLVLPYILFAQEGAVLDMGSAEVSVTLAANVTPNHVPMNRPVTLTVQISWQGDMDRIEIEDVEEPLLSHLEITGTASANHVLGARDGAKAVKEIIYTCLPTAMGMAYIESVGLRYQDTVTGESYFLRTERIGVEVLPAVKEKSAGAFPWWMIAAAGILVSGTGFFILRKRRIVSADENLKSDEIIEDLYLKELKTSISLQAKDRGQAFVALSKLLRRFLAAKFKFHAMEATTESLLIKLSNLELDESLIRKCELFFKEADVIKFSGEEATQAALDSAYTTVETIFEAYRAEAVKTREEQTTSKSGKRYRIRFR